MIPFLSVSSWWLLAGAIFMALEAFGVPGIGFLFAGLSAIAVGGLMLAGIVEQDAQQLQFTLWFVFTACFALALWKPLKRWRGGDGEPGNYSNMVGDLATITDMPLRKGHPGKARWSGTTMNAELEAQAPAVEIPVGAMAEIVEVRGTVLILKPHAGGAPTADHSS